MQTLGGSTGVIASFERGARQRASAILQDPRVQAQPVALQDAIELRRLAEKIAPCGLICVFRNPPASGITEYVGEEEALVVPIRLQEKLILLGVPKPVTRPAHLLG
jgi:hypothetical protein